MKEQELLLAAIHEQVSLHPYDATWPAAYAAECRRLGAALPNAFIELQHIGSTAIPGLVAKPVIDILAGVQSMAEAEALVILRARTELADQYAVLKSRWAERHRADREAYTAAKSEFVRTVLDSGSISAT